MLFYIFMSGCAKLLNTDATRIRIHNTAREPRILAVRHSTAGRDKEREREKGGGPSSVEVIFLLFVLVPTRPEKEIKVAPHQQHKHWKLISCSSQSPLSTQTISPHPPRVRSLVPCQHRSSPRARSSSPNGDHLTALPGARSFSPIKDYLLPHRARSSSHNGDHLTPLGDGS